MDKVKEYTQAALALVVVGVTAADLVIGRFHGAGALVSLPPEWWTTVGLVVGFYFGKNLTNGPTTVKGQ